ncbi:hypothetical protein MKW94_027360 [Papaver nudicaule]|uniref:non-specific serine/threonine protein kinase n=1 Tax=Papaver nudicaule TaxID=74823 RepID=A0AA41SBZ4_PAPNU|nr:hypothetical protein [Papaver nudicaule]
MDLSSTSRTEFLEDVDEPPDPDVVETHPSGKYSRYNEVLGRGAFKTVYKGFDKDNGIEVAWSQANIDEVVPGCAHDLQSKLFDEVNLLKTVHHKHIMKMYTSWVDNDKKTLNIITELFNSGSVRQYRIKHKKVDMKAVKGWARQILLGLDYLHSQNPPIIHRDVKCDNIFINGNHGEVKIGDMGLATVMEHDSLRSVIGTPAFMAPEIYEEDYNELVDIYSFGMCILEMTTNECPYSECENYVHIYKKVIRGIMPKSLSKVKDLETKKFIERCLGPAAERLPAKELLKDNFIQLKDSGTAGYCFAKQACAGKVLTLQEKESYTEQHVFQENTITITDVGTHPVPTLEVQRIRKENEFKLNSKKEDMNCVSFDLSISNNTVKGVAFPFYLKSDTAISVASEMIQHLNLADQTHRDIFLLAELIDVSITRLVPDWKPSVSIHHLVVIHQFATSISNSPLFDNSISTVETPSTRKLDDIKTRGDNSDAGTFLEENYIKSSGNTCMNADLGYMVYNSSVHDVSVNKNASNGSTVVSNKDNFVNKGMSLELEMIYHGGNLQETA